MELWKPTPYGPNRRELNWLNSCISIHDTFCGCDEPGDHLLLLLAKKSGYFSITKGALKEATKCLTSGEDHSTHVGKDGDQEDIGIDAGDLELLFADHEDEDHDTG